MFTIHVTNLHWLPGSEEDEDLCLHGHAVAVIGGERLEFDATVSATALYLLKSTREDHIRGAGLQMLPCCGHFLIANEDLTRVEIVGCDYGIDWSVLHEGDGVRLVTESGGNVWVSMADYRRTVFAFADEIEQFYTESKPKKMPHDEFERNGYLAFWKEWKELRNA
jgi:hypothetical protein